MKASRYFEQLLRSLVFAVLTTATLALPTAAKELTQPLTTEDVACNERQLERLLQRMTAGQKRYVTPQLATSLIASYSNTAGFYEGIVLTDEKFRLGPRRDTACGLL